MFFLFDAIHLIFQTYMLMILVRVMGSWFPSFYRHRIMKFLCQYTDPYLNVFKKYIPPIGGVLDLSPLLAFFSLQILEKLIQQLLLRWMM